MPTSIDALKEMLYRSQFRAAVAEAQAVNADAWPEALGIKASALFEQHRIDDAKAVAGELRKLAHDSNMAMGEHLYLQGKVAYFERQYEIAEDSFRTLIGSNPCGAMRVRAGLGMANVQYSLGNERQVRSIVEALLDMECCGQPDLRISIDMLRGNAALTLSKDLSRARALFLGAFGAAASRGWTYFMQRALYGLSRVARAKMRRRNAGLLGDPACDSRREGSALHVAFDQRRVR